MVAALICDQASTNVAAINKLKMETKKMYSRFGKDKKTFGFEIGNQEIIPLFDPPHLLKCMRNNLITTNLIFSDSGIQHVAKWEHLTQLYELDKTESNIGDRINPKLTDAHMYVEKMKKIKVLHAAQIFSQRVGSIMKLLATWSVKQLDPSAVDTAKFCLFMENCLIA
uniref:Transposable element P transposase-like GTP-binding insertion domain-containing protein n=1 Tax=Schizaphis graminum TaxID=13262 RepID=A0A2S2P1K5_SCHGA